MSLCEGNSLTGTSGINGDSFFISQDKTTILLADGASGAGKDGKVIMSNLCVEIIKNNPFSLSGLSAKEYLDNMIWKINNELISISQDKKKYIFGTLVIGVVQDNIATVIAVGDSPAYFINGQSITRIAKPQKAYQNLIDMGLYTEMQLEEAVRKLPEHLWSMFDRYIPMVVPLYAIEEIEMQNGDMIVLCCDGISDYIQPQNMKDAININDLPQSINMIINNAKEQSIKERKCVKYDDLTMVVYCYNN